MLPAGSTRPIAKSSLPSRAVSTSIERPVVVHGQSPCLSGVASRQQWNDNDARETIGEGGLQSDDLYGMAVARGEGDNRRSADDAGSTGMNVDMDVMVSGVSNAERLGSSNSKQYSFHHLETVRS